MMTIRERARIAVEIFRCDFKQIELLFKSPDGWEINYSVVYKVF